MNEDLIKQEFVRENIERDIRAIFEAQYLIATERVYTSAIYPTQVDRGGALSGNRGMDAWCGVLPACCSAPYATPFTASGFPGGGGRHFQRPPLYPLPGYEETWKLWHL
ncbi:hypothetical protein ACIXNO_01690 [Bacteroides fragilis]